VDLGFDGFRPGRTRKADRFDGMSRSVQCVRAHVADTDGLTGSPGHGHRARTLWLACSDTIAACLLSSHEADRPTRVATAATMMAGLNCGTISSAV
jgi:hypothetical protein